MACDGCIHTYMHASIHPCIHAYMHTCIHPSIHPSMHTCIHACMHAYMHACMHPSIHTHIQTCMHACMQVYMHAYIRDTHNQSNQGRNTIICRASVCHAFDMRVGTRRNTYTPTMKLCPAPPLLPLHTQTHSLHTQTHSLTSDQTSPASRAITNMSCSVTRRKGDRDKGMDGESGRERDEERK